MAFESLGHSSPVPAFEALLDRVPNELIEAEPRHELIRGAPVVLEHRLGKLSPGSQERRDHADSLMQWSATPQMAEHEQGS